MGVDDLVSTESAVVAAATAAVFSPRTRETLRRGAVLGVAGALKAGDVLAGAARGAARGMKSVGAEAAGVAADGRDVADGDRDASGSARPKAAPAPKPAKPRAKSSTPRPRRAPAAEATTAAGADA